MLSKSDVLAAIDLDVDYIGAASSVEEHGITLIPVNKYALCAEKLMDLPQSEWWPFTHCMFSIQKCMNYVSKEEAGFSSCDEAGRPRPFYTLQKGGFFSGATRFLFGGTPTRRPAFEPPRGKGYGGN